MRTRLLVLAVATLGLATTALALKPADFQGRPTFSAGSALGAYAWHDGDGLHLRFTTKGKPRHFHGKVCTPLQVVDMTPVRTDYGDKVRIGPEGHCVMYDFITADGIDGFDFRAPGGVLTWTVDMGDKPLSTSRIFVGSNGTHPANNPFVLDR